MQCNVQNKISFKAWTWWLQGRTWNHAEWLPKLQETDVQSNKQDQGERSDLAGTNGHPSVAKMREACSGLPLNALALSTLESLKELHLCGLKLSLLTPSAVSTVFSIPEIAMNIHLVEGLHLLLNNGKMTCWSMWHLTRMVVRWIQSAMDGIRLGLCMGCSLPRTSDLKGCVLDTVCTWHQTGMVVC